MGQEFGPEKVRRGGQGTDPKGRKMKRKEHDRGAESIYSLREDSALVEYTNTGPTSICTSEMRGR
jgi:hypothetical protein